MEIQHPGRFARTAPDSPAVIVGGTGASDVAVIGVPNEDMGEAVRVVDSVTHFKCPTSVVVVDDLPRLPTAKIARRLLPPEVSA